MAKAVSFIGETSHPSEFDCFIKLIERLGCPLNNIPIERIEIIDKNYWSKVLEINQNKFSNTFTNFLFENLGLNLASWEVFNPTGFIIKNPNDVKYEDLLELAECYEDDALAEIYYEEFNALFDSLVKQFCN